LGDGSTGSSFGNSVGVSTGDGFGFGRILVDGGLSNFSASGIRYGTFSRGGPAGGCGVSGIITFSVGCDDWGVSNVVGSPH